MKAIYYTHLISVILFLITYLIKTVLLLANKEESLQKYTRITKVPEMIISFAFLVTGIYMITQIPEVKSFMIMKLVAVALSIPLAVIGFKKRNKALAVVAMLLIIAAYGLAEMSKKQGLSQSSPAQPGAEVAAPNGHDIFVRNCTSCHGEDGKLGLMGSPDLTVSALTTDERKEIVKNGKGVMTGFAGILSEEEIEAVVKYTEQLK
jgi:mono/diheme cytochrome c family protein